MTWRAPRAPIWPAYVHNFCFYLLKDQNNPSSTPNEKKKKNYAQNSFFEMGGVIWTQNCLVTIIYFFFNEKNTV
jgi:hypothetical protein